MVPNFTLHNGVEVPATGLGTFLMKDPAEISRSICGAVKAGYRSFDTAMIYMNEEGVGRGIRDCGVSREALYVTTKLWNDAHGYEKALKAFSESLKRLGLEYVDEYLMHWPGLDEEYVPTWKAFEKLYQDGMIRAIGVCNFTKLVLKNLLEQCRIRPMVNQVEMHPFFQPNDLIDYCEKNQVLVEAWRPIVWGKLDRDDITSAARKYGKTPVQIALRWHYQRGVRTLPKTVHKERMEQNLDIFDFALTTEEVLAINKLNTFVRTGESPDEFFELGGF